jgi:hypothetical protein
MATCIIEFGFRCVRFNS